MAADKNLFGDNKSVSLLHHALKSKHFQVQMLADVYLLNTFFCGLGDSRYSARVMPKKMCFLPEKEDKRKFCLCSGTYAYFSLDNSRPTLM